MSANRAQRLSRDQILAALQRLSDFLAAEGVSGELCIFGGATMVLAYNARVSTKDVDALFQPSNVIRREAAHVADEHGLPPDWLNDGVKGFISARHDLTSEGLPQFSNLRLTMPVPEYLLAMKCMAARIGEGAHLNLKTPNQVLDIVARYYGKSRISVKTQYLVEGLFEDDRT